MECWVHLFSLCVFDPSNVAIEADVSRQLAGDFTYHSGGQVYGGGTVGRIFITDSVSLTKTLTFTYGVEHRSLVGTRSDRGEERFSVGFTWRPFSR